MKILIISDATFPTNRPILKYFWNYEMSRKSVKLFWVLPSFIKIKNRVHTTWSSSDLFLFPIKEKKSMLISLENILLRILMIFSLSRLLINNKNIEWIHVHDGHLESLIGTLLSKFYNIPLSVGYTAPFTQFRKKAIIGSKGFEHIKKSLSFIILNNIYKLAFRQAKLLFPISKSLGQQISVEHKISSKKMLPVSESGSHTFLNFPLSKPFSQRPKNILYIGSLDKERKLSFLINSFEKVLNVYPRTKLIIVGEGDDQYQLEKLSRDLKISSNILFVGRKPNFILPYISFFCVAGVSPIPPEKHYLHSTPTKVIDYLSFGLPVIANKEIEDQQQLISQSFGGLNVDYNISSFSEGIVKVLKELPNFEARANKGRKWLKLNRTFELSALEVYKKMEKLI